MTSHGYDPVDLQPRRSLAAHSYTASLTHDNDTDSMSIPLTNIPASSRRPSGYDMERAASSDRTTGSWDMFAGAERYEQSDAKASNPAYAEGDIPDNQASKLYHYLLNASIITRWIIFIVPILAIIWIPGILALTDKTKFGPDAASVWGVPLLWWSIWLSVCWGGWWAASAFSRIAPIVIRKTVGIIAVGTRRYLDWLQALHRYVATFLWTLAIFVSYQPLIDSMQNANASTKSVQIIQLGQKLFFAFFLCAGILLFEKFSIQWIAGKFHERSYAERIADQKFAVSALVTLYRNSKSITRPDMVPTNSVKDMLNPKRFFRRAMKGVREAATTTTTVFGNVASEIAGTSVLQPNSPQSIVKTSLQSATRSQELARRLFFSFAKPGNQYLLVEDIARFFGSPDEADKVFALFDQDSNGDATREEIEMSIMEIHREQLSIEHSMQDLDSAVGRLDNIFMSLYVIIAILIIAVALEAQVATLVTSAGTLLLGLSWLIGGSLAEVLTSIIFLFIKHPFDVGDRIVVTGSSYTVKEIRLLSTILIDSHGASVQAPNTVLNSTFIENIRRSPQMSETFTFDVSYSTSFEDIEKLRQRMLAFVAAERRDYRSEFDVQVLDFPDQAKMTLSANINYKSNSQQSALKTKRRNKWVCALKSALFEVGIFGPSGDPNAEPAAQRYTQVPWHEVKAEDAKAHQTQSENVGSRMPEAGWELSGKDAILHEGSDGIFDDPVEPTVQMPQPNTESRTMPAPSTYRPS